MWISHFLPNVRLDCLPLIAAATNDDDDDKYTETLKLPKCVVKRSTEINIKLKIRENTLNAKTPLEWGCRRGDKKAKYKVVQI